MKKLVIFLLMCTTICTSVKAQLKDEAVPFSQVTLSNGASVSSSFNQQTGILSVEVENNDDEVEVIVVENDTVIDSESTIFEEDELQVELPMSSQPLDIYVRTKEETLYVGSVNK